MTYEKRQAKAYRMYVRYQSHTAEYLALAKSFGFDRTGQLNAMMNGIYNARRVARAAKRVST